MKVSKSDKSDKAIKPILTACYPDWKGRKVSLAVCGSYQMSDYWSEGSRNFVKAYSLVDGKVAETLHAARVPWTGEASARVRIPGGVALVEHSIFCGKDAGVTMLPGGRGVLVAGGKASNPDDHLDAATLARYAHEAEECRAEERAERRREDDGYDDRSARWVRR